MEGENMNEMGRIIFISFPLSLMKYGSMITYKNSIIEKYHFLKAFNFYL